MTADELRACRRRLVLTRPGLAMRLEISERSIAYYEDGERPIPRVVELACWALEHSCKT